MRALIVQIQTGSWTRKAHLMRSHTHALGMVLSGGIIGQRGGMVPWE